MTAGGARTIEVNLGKVPEGKEPEITPVAEGTAPPSRGAAPAAAGAKALTSEGDTATNLAPAAAPAQKPAGVDPGGLIQGIKGLFGR